jgi:hypothetical protein
MVGQVGALIHAPQSSGRMPGVILFHVTQRVRSVSVAPVPEKKNPRVLAGINRWLEGVEEYGPLTLDHRSGTPVPVPISYPPIQALVSCARDIHEMSQGTSGELVISLACFELYLIS